MAMIVRPMRESRNSDMRIRVLVLLVVLVVLVGLTLAGTPLETAIALVSGGALLAGQITSWLVEPMARSTR